MEGRKLKARDDLHARNLFEPKPRGGGPRGTVSSDSENSTNLTFSLEDLYLSMLEEIPAKRVRTVLPVEYS